VSRQAFEEALAQPVAPLDEVRKPAVPPKSARFAMVHTAECACGCQDDDWSPIEDERPATTTKTDTEGGRSAAPTGRPIAASGSDVHRKVVSIHPTPKANKKQWVAGSQKVEKALSDEFDEYTIRYLARELHRMAKCNTAACCGFKTGAASGDATLETGFHKSGPRAGQKTAVLTGTVACDSPWLCPVCGPRLSRMRTDALGPQAREYQEKGYSSWLLTLTAQHNRDTPLCVAIDLFTKAWAYLKRGKAWNEKAKKCKGLEYIRGYDLTWTESGGWHLHFHLVVLIGPGDRGFIGALQEFERDNGKPKHQGRFKADGQETAEWLLDRWKTAVEANGGRVSWSGLDMRQAANAEAAVAYAATIAGVGKHTEKAKEKEVDLAEMRKGFSTVMEAIGAAGKRGQSYGSRTAAQIREDALTGCAKSRALYLEYAEATLGLRAVVVSQGLTLDPEKVEKEEEEEEVVERERIAVIRESALPTLDPFLARTLRAAKKSAYEAHTVLTSVLGAPGPTGLWQIPDMSAEGQTKWREEGAEFKAWREKAKRNRAAERKAEREKMKIRAKKDKDLEALEETVKKEEETEREALLDEKCEEAKANGYLDLAIHHTLRKRFRADFPTINEVSEGVFRIYPSRVRMVMTWKLAH
jgi:Replication protein